MIQKCSTEVVTQMQEQTKENTIKATHRGLLKHQMVSPKQDGERKDKYEHSRWSSRWYF